MACPDFDDILSDDTLDGRVVILLDEDHNGAVGDIVQRATDARDCYRVIRLLDGGCVLARRPRWHDRITIFVGRLTGQLPS